MSVADVARAAAAILAGARHAHLLLLLDFDGTLAEFQPDPRAVWLSPARRELLLALDCRPSTTLAIVSGRRLEDVRQRTNLPGTVYYAGLHGLEVEGGGESFVHPDVAPATELLRQVTGHLAEDLRDIPGAIVEDKGLSVAAHWRDASPQDGQKVPGVVQQRAAEYLASGRLKLLPGSFVLELLPNIDWNKGSAVAWIRDRVAAAGEGVFPVYIGDDTTDEDAFRVVRGGGGVAIASSPRPSGADFVVDGPPEVERMLAAVLSFEC